jgi:Leucine-rich repeat (LRR) protein
MPNLQHWCDNQGSRVYENPLYRGNTNGNSQPDRNKKGRKLSYLNKSLGAHCRQSTTLVGLAINTVLTICALFFITQEEKIQGEPLQVLCVAIGGSLINIQMLRMHEESNGLKRSLLPLTLTAGFAVLFLFLLVFNTLPTSENDKSVENVAVTVPAIDTNNCTIITATSSQWRSCLKNRATVGTLITLETLGVSFQDMDQEKALVLVDTIFSDLKDIVLKFKTETEYSCMGRMFDSVCERIFSKCDLYCNLDQTLQNDEDICKKNESGTMSDLFSFTQGLREPSHPTRLIVLQHVQKILKKLDLESERMKQRSFNTADAIIVLMKEVVYGCSSKSNCSLKQSKETNLDCSRNKIDKYVKAVNEVKRREAATTTNADVHLYLATFWYSCGIVVLGFVTDVKSLRRSIQRDLALNKKLTVVPYKYLGQREKIELCFCATVSLLMSFVCGWHAARQEKYATENSVYGWIAFYYLITLFALKIALRQYASVVRGLYYVRQKNSETKKKQKKINVLSRWHKIYNSLFGLRVGRLFFAKQAFSEMIEVLLQFISLGQVTEDANIAFVTASLVLMLINSIVSPMLLLLHCQLNDQQRRILIYAFDATLEMLYFTNNVWRGGSLIVEVETNPFVNFAISWPVLSIILKTRALHSILTVGTRKPESSEQYLPSPPSKHVSTAEKILARTYVERCIGIAIVIVAPLCLGFVAILLYTEYYRCMSEFGPTLWNSASPIYMYKGKNINIFNPSCGYPYIEKIDANFYGPSGHKRWSKMLVSLPEQIRMCSNLTELNLADHNIKSLPKGFFELKQVRTATFTNNPVHTNLSIIKYGLKGTFPQKILCDHFSESLVSITASGNVFDRIAPCIGKFTSISYIGLSDNKIAHDGFPIEITKLKGATIEIRGNPIEKHMSWRNKFSGKGSHYLEDGIAFLKNIFPATMLQHLDLSGCDFEKKESKGGEIVYDLLEHFRSLEVLNVSNTDISRLFGDEPKNVTSLLGKWKKLKVLDASKNDKLTSVSQALAAYYENRTSFDLLLKNTVSISTLLYPDYHRAFPKRLLNLKAIQESVNAFILGSADLEKSSLSYFCRLKNLKFLGLDALTVYSIEEIPPCFSKLSVFYLVNVITEKVQWAWPSYFWQYDSIVIDFGFKNITNVSFPLQSNSKLQILAMANIDNNNLTSGFPNINSIIFPELKQFVMVQAQLTGNIPLFNNSNLERFSVQYNLLSGPIPALLFRVNGQLKNIHLHWNREINGKLPEISEKRASKIDCFMLHGTSIAGPVPKSYFEGIGLLTLPGTLQLHNLTGNAAASNVDNGTKDIPYGRMICHYAHFRCSKPEAKLLPPIEQFSEKNIVCYGDDSDKCGRLIDDDEWNFFDVYVNGLNLGRGIKKSLCK